MDIIGKVVEIDMDATITKQSGGSYKGIKIVYKDKEGSYKEQVMHNNALKYNSAMKATLNSLNAGDTFTMTKEKEGEFWNVKSIVAGAIEKAVSEVKSSGSVGATTNRSSTYETADERARRQVFIIRQSSIANAVAYCGHFMKDGEDIPAPQVIIQIAKEFESYILSGDSGSIEDLPSDIL